VTSADVRIQLVSALETDLIGPGKGSALESEVLPQAPSRWYLTGFLVPLDAGEEQRMDETVAEEVGTANDAGDPDDASTPEPAALRRAFFPSSIGLSLLVPEQTKKLSVTVRWGDYRMQSAKAEGHAPAAGREAEGTSKPSAGPSAEAGTPASTPAEAGTPAARPGPSVWRRTPREEVVTLALPAQTAAPVESAVPKSDGLRLALSVRPVNASVAGGGLVPAGTRSVSVFLVNRRVPGPDEIRDERFAFQAEIVVLSGVPFVPRPNLRGLTSDDWDEQVADLQYRDAFEFAVGHGVATRAIVETDGQCRTAETCWIPVAEVERVAPAPIDGVELGMEALAALVDGADASLKLGNLVARYRDWINAQRTEIPANPTSRKDTAEELLKRAEYAAKRIEAGIAQLQDPQALEAFRIANRTMATAARRRFGAMQGKDPAAIAPPSWRPFQLAFILMNLRGIAQPTDADREVVDLLFFPTGGGKTEAYLGLAAFTLVLRRLRNPGINSAGLSVLMRYTLRLLTLDQLSRAATLICALELERIKDPKKLGPWPFEIGLWVGKAATPNRMGEKGDRDATTARAKTIAFQNDDRKPSPIPLEECPWCGTKFTRLSFRLLPDPDYPTDLRVGCANKRCEFSRERHLPILGVDEPIYRRLPCFMIATVDKFAAMPWTGQVGAFFGRVDRYDAGGFYGPCDPGVGQRLPAGVQPLGCLAGEAEGAQAKACTPTGLLPPELVIQDELHLISGPLGTIVGLYETALDELCAREVGEHKIRPKIVASTATVRRAEKQIRALFNRRQIDIFPPPGADRRDSFFAHTHTPEESNARLYLGVAAQGRSPKVMLLRTYLALLGAAQKAYKAAGGAKNPNNPADPYMTLLGYFNSLRELGGSRRIIEDEITTRLVGFASRKRVGETEGLFENRKIAYEPVELTSRESTAKVAEAKRRLALQFVDKDHVDVAIATNMISVGLDIVRLGLMVVFGQPKTSAEYIQATSRVGRDSERPGLVVTLCNIHRPRDRSHYERFAAYHDSFYRSVEATSVTPFSPRALDRGLAGTLVALARQGHLPMTPPKGASEILRERMRLDFVVDRLAERARTHDWLPTDEADALRESVRIRAIDLLDNWSRIADDYLNQGVALQYQEETGAARRLLYQFLDPELKKLAPRHQKFRANRSMRDVESSVNVWIRTLNDIEVEVEEDEP